MIFEFKIWYKTKLFNDLYLQRRFAVDLGYMPINFIQGHIINTKDGQVKCTLVTFHDGTKKIAIEQYTAFINKYKEFIELNTAKQLPSAN